MTLQFPINRTPPPSPDSSSIASIISANYSFEFKASIMVQYRTNQRAYSPRSEEARDWWKLDDRQDVTRNDARSILQKRGFAHIKSSTKPRFVALLLRSDRGLRSYEKCSKAELLELCLAQGHARSDTRNVSKADLIALLENHEPDFPRFMELPPELRLHVYEQHLASFESVGLCVPTPITAVCQTVRTEALPLFFDTHRFLFDAENLWAVSPAGPNLADLPDSAFSQMRKLRLKGLSVEEGVIWQQYVVCDIDLGGKSTSPCIEDCYVLMDTTDGEFDEALNGMRRRVMSVLEAMALRPEGKKFQRNDVDFLFDAVMDESWRGDHIHRGNLNGRRVVLGAA
ncbi:hypothetical protein LTR56_004769 [Elasticomyces elasticus]|nr:hypothetical protein LTR56_004769 [Elasticomyces elasticus]KAK3665625.1 hypothetical protein LTR22_003565 [Elasticomyces elasticus]KAK4930337.1 hypothetical protein LTR49_003078 [Elasticomyces elasticus]KAK5768936.1 hypothetical protein LTS12_000996 [Elasticomyces elasticus]